MVATKVKLLAPLPSTERGTSTIIDSSPDGLSFVYTNNRSVYIRNLNDPTLCYQYSEHLSNCTVARYSPNGNYIASGNTNGQIRIFDITQPDTMSLKLETSILSNRINDLSWCFESKRLLAVGEGSDKFGHFFSYDSGNSIGEVIGHAKPISSCCMKPGNRPFYAITGGKDFNLNLYKGTPFKFIKSYNDHTNVINVVKYNNDGNLFCSVGADRKIFMYNGNEGEKVGNFNDDISQQHQGSIYGLSFSPNLNQFITSSADKTVKLWDIETSKCLQTLDLNNTGTYLDQQVGNLWSTSDQLLSLSLNGVINYLDLKSNKIYKKVNGHNSGINQLIISKDNTLFTGGNDGKLLNWNKDDIAEEITGVGHSNKINKIISNNETEIINSIGMDDYLKKVEINKFSDLNLKLESEPIDIIELKSQQLIIITNDKSLLLIENNDITLKLLLKYQPKALINYNNNIIIGYENNQLELFKLDNDKVELIGTINDDKYQVTAMAISNDHKYLAVGQSNGKILLLENNDDDNNNLWKIKTTRWSYHTSSITSLTFSSDSKYCLSTSIDTNLYLWSTQSTLSKNSIINAHKSPLTDAKFINYPSQVNKNDIIQIVIVGTDGVISKWDIELPA